MIIDFLYGFSAFLLFIGAFYLLDKIDINLFDMVCISVAILIVGIALAAFCIMLGGFVRGLFL